MTIKIKELLRGLPSKYKLKLISALQRYRYSLDESIEMSDDLIADYYGTELSPKEIKTVVIYSVLMKPLGGGGDLKRKTKKLYNRITYELN